MVALQMLAVLLECLVAAVLLLLCGIYFPCDGLTLDGWGFHRWLAVSASVVVAWPHLRKPWPRTLESNCLSHLESSGLLRL